MNLEHNMRQVGGSTDNNSSTHLVCILGASAECFPYVNSPNAESDPGRYIIIHTYSFTDEDPRHRG